MDDSFKTRVRLHIDKIKHDPGILRELALPLSEDDRARVLYPYHDCGEYILITGSNATDFLGDMYSIDELGHLFACVECQFAITDPMAVMPSKTRLSDVGYDLTIIAEHAKWNNTTSLYDTGIRVSVEPHFYLEVVPRSSLSKSGYMLANSVGIIDPSYTGNIYIALTKVDPDAKPITFPFKCCQLIIRPHYQAQRQQDQTVPDPTAVAATAMTRHRGAGGFGSTDP